MKHFAINRKLFPLKAHFFFSSAGGAPVVPFLPTIARQLGFSSVVVGIVYTILPFIALLMKPLSGIISDKYQIHKKLFLAFQVFGIVSLLGINFIEPLQHNTTLGLRIDSVSAVLQQCSAAGGHLDSCAANEIVDRYAAMDAVMSCLVSCRTNDSEHSLHFCPSPSEQTTCAFTLRVTVDLAHINYTDDCLQMPLLQLPEPRPPAGESQCEAQCTNKDLMYQLTDNKISDAMVMRLPQFWTFFVCMVVSWTAMTVVTNLADTICFQMLGDQPHLYGKQRLWAAIGWGVSSLFAGYMVDAMSRGAAIKDYSGVFVLMAVLLALDVLCSCSLSDVHTTRSASMLRDIGSLLRSPTICVFLAVCVAVGMGTALLWNFLFWHLEELAEADTDGCGTAREWMKTLQGLAMGVQCFGGELPFFFYSGALLKRIGHTHAMSLVLLTMSVRFLLYSMLTNPWWVLPIELCQGITYGIFYTTMASYASKVAPPGMASTVQGLVGAVHEGIGIASGSLIGGFLMARLGGSLAFRWYGGVGLVLCVVHVVAQAVMERFDMGRLEGRVEASDGMTERGVEMGAGKAVVEHREVYRTVSTGSGDEGVKSAR